LKALILLSVAILAAFIAAIALLMMRPAEVRVIPQGVSLSAQSIKQLSLTLEKQGQNMDSASSKQAERFSLS